MTKFQKPSEMPKGFGVRQSSGAMGRGYAVESGRGLPQSKTQARDGKSTASMQVQFERR